MSELLSVEEVARLLNVSPETVTRRFADVKGVIDIGAGGKRRRYRVLRIPRTVVEKWVLQRGGRITVEPKPPLKPPKPVKPTVSEDEMTRDLATLVTQHGDAARKTLERIARRAKAMTYVPAEQWEDMAFFDLEDES